MAIFTEVTEVLDSAALYIVNQLQWFASWYEGLEQGTSVLQFWLISEPRDLSSQLSNPLREHMLIYNFHTIVQVPCTPEACHGLTLLCLGRQSKLHALKLVL